MTVPIDNRPIVWFDIDNTLYSASSQISHAMGVKIHEYFVNTLGLSHEEASKLHLGYYTQYGLALAGLVRHHHVGKVGQHNLKTENEYPPDPLDFDRKCDQALPLEEMIHYKPSLRKLFEDIDRSKFRVWALTNAYRPHAERVLRILNLTDLVDGLIYCDYEAKDLISKPDPVYYRKAMETAGVSEPSKCYFIDDNKRNVQAAIDLGWKNSVHFCEKGLEHVEGGKVMEINNKAASDGQPFTVISDLEELRQIWPEIFKSI
ncbi:putative suppressor of disruption of TFIIS [Marasmius crinis-equi]|uniref:Suppressor of disruption of TFIIS n=1 Tax=Marasmius crinis-equi TaxID=585013 RepID=A0ABR3EQA0_9AGAR